MFEFIDLGHRADLMDPWGELKLPCDNIRDITGDRFLPQNTLLLVGGGFKCLLFSSLFGGDEPILIHIFHTG